MILSEEELTELGESIANIVCDLGCTPNNPTLDRDSKHLGVEIQRRGKWFCALIQVGTVTSIIHDEARYSNWRWNSPACPYPNPHDIADIRDPEWLDKLLSTLYDRWEQIRGINQKPINMECSEYVKYIRG